MSLKIWGLVVLLLVVIIFSLQNTAPITVKLLAWEISTSNAFFSLTTLGIGLVIGLIFGNFYFRSRPSKKS